MQSSSTGPSGSIPHSLKILKAALSYKSGQGSMCSNVQEAGFRETKTQMGCFIFVRTENPRNPCISQEKGEQEVRLYMQCGTFKGGRKPVQCVGEEADELMRDSGGLPTEHIENCQ